MSTFFTMYTKGWIYFWMLLALSSVSQFILTLSPVVPVGDRGILVHCNFQLVWKDETMSHVLSRHWAPLIRGRYMVFKIAHPTNIICLSTSTWCFKLTGSSRAAVWKHAETLLHHHLKLNDVPNLSYSTFVSGGMIFEHSAYWFQEWAPQPGCIMLLVAFSLWHWSLFSLKVSMSCSSITQKPHELWPALPAVLIQDDRVMLWHVVISLITLMSETAGSSQTSHYTNAE